ncbi:hypothetical protein ACLOJK_035834 [Asimina triloba]
MRRLAAIFGWLTENFKHACVHRMKIHHIPSDLPQSTPNNGLDQSLQDSRRSHVEVEADHSDLKALVYASPANANFQLSSTSETPIPIPAAFQPLSARRVRRTGSPTSADPPEDIATDASSLISSKLGLGCCGGRWSQKRVSVYWTDVYGGVRFCPSLEPATDSDSQSKWAWAGLGAEALGLPYLNAYLDSIGTNFTHGANFATAGSCIRPQNTTLFNGGFSPFSLDVQTWQFDQFITRSQTASNRSDVFKGLMPQQDYFSRALYTFDIGQNDLTAGYFLGWGVDEVKANIPDILNKFTIVIKNIYGQGGRFFWIHNTGPVGCLPYIMDRLLVTAAQVDKIGCATPFNEVAQYFNAKLKETVNKLRKDLPLAAFTYVDVYSVKYDLLHNSKKHGFEHPLRACCGHGGKYNYNKKLGCGGKVIVRGKEVLIGKACSNPSTAINWDGVHYTQAANKFVFDKIVDGAYSDPPIPLSMACQGKKAN